MTYATSLSAALRNAVAAKTGVLKAPGKPGKGKKRSKAHITEDSAPAPLPSSTVTAAQTKKSDWGLLEPIRGLLGPLADVIEMFFTAQGIIVLLALLLIYSWFFRTPATGISYGGNLPTAHRQVAYEEIWRAEEADLWKWLEERVALDRVHSSVTSGRVLQSHNVQSKIVAEGMRERQMDEAIRTTEEKLRELKGAVKRERESLTKSPKEAET
jgi:hypothetical protein